MGFIIDITLNVIGKEGMREEVNRKTCPLSLFVCSSWISNIPEMSEWHKITSHGNNKESNRIINKCFMVDFPYKSASQHIVPYLITRFDSYHKIKSWCTRLADFFFQHFIQKKSNTHACLFYFWFDYILVWGYCHLFQFNWILFV